MSLREAVENGPRMAAAKTAHIEARIRHMEAEAKKAHEEAAALRRRAKGDGPLAKSRKLRADARDAVADRRRAKANDLRADLAKAKADEASRQVKHVKRTVASTAASGLVPKAPGQVGPTKPAQAKPAQAIPATTKGSTMSTVSGEAVNFEQTEASLNQLKSQVTDLRSSFENMAGSLASGGLNKLAGSFATADDGLSGVLTEITAAEKHLADQRGIAEAAQAAGEMHTDAAFYG